MAYRFANQSEVKELTACCMKILYAVQDEVSDYFTFDIRLIGSGDKRLVTQNSDESFDLDYNIILQKDKKGLLDNPKQIKDIFVARFNKVLKQCVSGYIHVSDSTSVVTVKIIRNNRLEFSFDVAIIVEGDDGYFYRLTHDKRTDRYIWNQVTLIKETGRKITSLGLKNSSAKLLPANSILVSSRATIGRVAISKVELATNQGFKNIVIKDFSKVDPYYIALMLSVQKDKLSNMATGGTFKEFSKRALENFQIPLPPIEIQKQIVAEIESYQKIIDGAKLVVGNYKPTYSCGGINCEKKTIKDVVVFNPAKTEVKDFVGDVSFVPMSEVQEHSIHFECKGTKKINEVYIGYTYFRESDVLIAKVTPCFENGKSGIARNLTNGIGFGSSEFFVLRAYNEIILPELIYCVISSNEFISQGKEHMTGTGGLKRLNKNFVLNYPIFVPPMEEQKLIVQRIQQEYEIVEANKKLISIFEQKIKDKLSEVWGE